MLGIVENMSGYVCPHCSTCTNVFSSGGGKALAEHAKVESIYEITAPCVTSFLCYLQVPFLGCVPLEPQLALAAESGSSFVEKFSDSKVDLESLSPSLHDLKLIITPMLFQAAQSLIAIYRALQGESDGVEDEKMEP